MSVFSFRNVFISAVVAVAALAGCTSYDDGGSTSGYFFGTGLGARIPTPPTTTNRHDGLTTYWKRKSKIYNYEQIAYVGDPSIGGLRVDEEDPEFAIFKNEEHGAWSNVWTTATVTNGGTTVHLQGCYEDASSFRTKSDDAFLSVVTSVDLLPESEYTKMTNSGNSVSIYKTSTFDSKSNAKYFRNGSVSASDVSDVDTAISAFNALLNGLKAQ